MLTQVWAGVRAIADHVGVAGDVVVVEGHVRRPAGPIEEEPLEPLVLALGGGHEVVRWTERPDRRRRYGGWSGFRAEVPLARWPRGPVRPRLEVVGLELPLRPSRALFRTLRLGVVPGVDAALDVRSAGDEVVVQVEAASRAGTLARRSDLRAVLRRQPLWGWRLVRLLTPWLHRRPLWLVAERRDTAQDNGAALFAHLRRERPDVRARYVVARGTEAWRRIRPLGAVVAAGSWRHRLLMWHASHLVTAFDPDVYAVPPQWRRDDYVEHVRPRVGTRRAFLQHGTIYRDVSVQMGRLVAGYDLVLTSAEQERAWIAGRLGYGDRAVLTGLPRHDLLEPAREGLRVLFAPTWRSDLVVPSYREGAEPGVLPEAADSGYARFVRGFLGHPGLLEALERLDATVEVLPHYEAADLLREVVAGHERVRLVDQTTESFSAVLRRAAVFVTDYSSTLFDAALLGLPVVVAHVDPDFEESGRPQAYDLRDVGLGPVVDDVDAAVGQVVRYLEAGGAREPEREAAVRSFFAFAGDRHNAARAVAAIEAMD